MVPRAACQPQSTNIIAVMSDKIDLTISVDPEMLEPIDALAQKYHWTRERAIVQMIDDWARTFAWNEHERM